MATPLFLAMMWTDVSRMRIPNFLPLIGIAIFIVLSPVIGFEQALIRLGVAVVSFALCFAAFALGWLGGGDTKIIPVVLLFVPSAALALYLQLFAVSLAIGLAAVLFLRSVFGKATSNLVGMRPGREFPMGVPIGLSGLAMAAVPLLLKG